MSRTRTFRAEIRGVKFLVEGDPEGDPNQWAVACEHTRFTGVCYRCWPILKEHIDSKEVRKLE